MVRAVQDFSFAVKIGFIVALLLSLLVITSVFGIYKITLVGQEMETISKEDMPLIELVSDVTIKQLEKAILIEKAMRSAGAGRDTDNISHLHKNITQLAEVIDKEIKQGEEIIAVAKTHAISEQQEKELIQLEKDLFAIEEEHHVYEQKVEALLAVLESGQQVSNTQVLELEEAQTEIDHHLTTLLKGVEKMTEHAMETVSHDEQEALQGMIILSLISVIFGLIMGIALTRSITRPLRSAVSAAERLAQGDLTVQIDSTGRDETGQLLTAMKHMAAQLLDTVSHISSAAEQLNKATSGMSSITTDTATCMESQRNNLNQTAAAVHEMSATVGEIAQSAQLAATSTSSADMETKEGLKVIDNVNGMISSLSDDIASTKEAITRLDEQTANVGSILEVITDIADQTNLLALNAAIEAARAGEQGRGFAVVADEVRTLASRTQDSITTIHQLITSLQQESKNSVTAMELGEKKVEESVEMARKASSALITIERAVSSITEMNLQIASASEEQSVVAEQINSSVTEIHQASEDTNNGAQQIAVSTGELSQMALSLRNLVQQFKIAT
ncbi:methyl-accepting chemotaxis protein [Pontibacterium sp.]|uniref:methyl-accepting chemotaxis protein n=2 Tax=Pontibacterium sp. TaxID=2036026 RepID=UPI0035139979